MFGRNKKPAQTTQSAPDSLPKKTPYDKLFSGKEKAVSDAGFLTIHLIGDKVYLEVPDSVFGRELLFSSYIDRTSDVETIYPGMSYMTPKRIVMDKTDSLVLFRLPRFNVYAKDDDPNIGQALAASRVSAITEAFPIKALSNDGTAVVFEATSFFTGANKDLVDFRGRATGGSLTISGATYQSKNSRIDGISAFDQSVSVSTESGISLSLVVPLLGLETADKPELTVGIVASLTLLPQSRMPVREADPRIGVAYNRFTTFEASGGSRTGYFVSRWRVEPADRNAAIAGEGSDVLEPIVFYVDTLFNENWFQAIRKGVEVWNDAFRKAGFRNVLQVCRFPADSTFRANDPLVSCILLEQSTMTNLSSRVLTDPRTGEILSAKIHIPRDYVSSVRKNAIYQISDVDPRYADYFIPEDAVCEALACDVMKRMAAVLGLLPNYAGSRAYSIEQLRDPEFTRRYGITSSVTDDVMFNYIAMPGDKERGVETIVSKPGLYDDFAIQWLYSYIPQQEKATLNDWLNEKSGDSRYAYGKRQSGVFTLDPRALAGDLSDDPFAATEHAISHFRYVIRNSPQWLADDRIPYSYKSLFPDFLFLQMSAHVRNLAVYIGGIHINEYRDGSQVQSYEAIPREVQKKALQNILTLCDDFSWMDANKEFLLVAGANNNMSQMAYATMPIQSIMSKILRIMSLNEQKSDDPYTQKEALDDLSAYLFQDVRRGQPIASHRFLFIEQYISSLRQASPILSANYNKAKGVTSISIADETAWSAQARNDESLWEHPIENLYAFDKNAMEPISSIDYFFPANVEPVCYLKLKEARNLLLQGRAYCRDGFTREKYDYLISTITLALGSGI